VRGEREPGWLVGHLWCRAALAADTGDSCMDCFAAMGGICLPLRVVAVRGRADEPPALAVGVLEDTTGLECMGLGYPALSPGPPTLIGLPDWGESRREVEPARARNAAR
jgi:hypothetical protein